MTELSPKARALIARTRSSLRPTASDRERIEAALTAKLEGPQPAAARNGHARGTRWQLIAGGTVGMLLLSAIALPALKTEPREPTRRMLAPTSIVAPPPEAKLSEKIAEPNAAPPAEPNAPLEQPSAKRPRAKNADRLGIEVELLSRATRALRAGNANVALTVLNEHQRRFPNGALQLERRIAKARALCSLDRVQEGRVEIEDLPREAPATARAREACGL